MIRIEGRFEVRLISTDALRQYMRFRGFTIRSLAERAGVSHSTIGHLVNTKSGRKTCRAETARTIAKALDCPVESLFIAKVSRVAREVAAA